MSNNIILYNNIINDEIVSFFQENIFLNDKQKIIYFHNENITKIIAILFLENKKNTKKTLNKQQYKFLKNYLWPNIFIINGYELIYNHENNSNKKLSFDYLKQTFNYKINFINFKNENGVIDHQLIINPISHDDVILTNDSNKINTAIFYLDENGRIDYFENDIDNIGTNIISIENDDAKDFIQCINVGTRNILKAEQLVVFLKITTFNKIIKNQFHNSTIKIIKKHAHVTYLINTN